MFYSPIYSLKAPGLFKLTHTHLLFVFLLITLAHLPLFQYTLHTHNYTHSLGDQYSGITMTTANAIHSLGHQLGQIFGYHKQ